MKKLLLLLFLLPSTVNSGEIFPDYMMNGAKVTRSGDAVILKIDYCVVFDKNIFDTYLSNNQSVNADAILIMMLANMREMTDAERAMCRGQQLWVVAQNTRSTDNTRPVYKLNPDGTRSSTVERVPAGTICNGLPLGSDISTQQWMPYQGGFTDYVTLCERVQ